MPCFKIRAGYKPNLFRTWPRWNTYLQKTFNDRKLMPCLASQVGLDTNYHCLEDDDVSRLRVDVRDKEPLVWWRFVWTTPSCPNKGFPLDSLNSDKIQLKREGFRMREVPKGESLSREGKSNRHSPKNLNRRKCHFSKLITKGKML